MENKNTSKSARRKLFFTRCGIFAILLLMLLPMLCSAAPPSQTSQVTVTIENPNNLPQDMTISNFTGGGELQFGTNSTSGNIVSVVDGVVDGGLTDLPDGVYIMFILLVEQSSGYYNTLVPNGDMFTVSDIPVFLSYAPKLTVAASDEAFIGDEFIFLVPMPNPTDSLLNTWTSITNWVISSLKTVQGVFIHDNSIRSILDMTNSLTVEGTTLYLADSDDALDLYYNGTSFADINFDLTDVVVDNVNYTLSSFDGQLLVAQHISTDGITSYLNPVLTTAASGIGLTLLGTLAVIGVSIGICFLLIGIIQRFLKLRG